MAKKSDKAPAVDALEQQQRTLREHRKQLDSIAALAQRELIRAGVLGGPPTSGWKLEDAYPTPPGVHPEGTVPFRIFIPGTKVDPDAPPDPNALTTVCPGPVPSDARDAAQLFLRARPAAVLGAALEVEDALAKAHGLLQRAADLMNRYAAIADEVNEFLVDHGEELVNRLRTEALSDRVATYGTDCTPLDFTKQVNIINFVGVGSAARAEQSRQFARSIEERVLAANAVYEHQRQGPDMHFLALLDALGLDEEQIADVLDEWPSRSDHEHEMDWEDACTKAKRAISVRVRRANEKLGTRDPRSRVPLDQRVLVLFCRYVLPGQPISLHIRSGGGVQDADRERAPLDPDGPAPERPARS